MCVNSEVHLPDWPLVLEASVVIRASCFVIPHAVTNPRKNFPTLFPALGCEVGRGELEIVFKTAVLAGESLADPTDRFLDRL